LFSSYTIDLKPENILLTFDEEQEKCLNLKLCDFGLSTVFTASVPLTEFCGTAGFFAAEMLIDGKYYGDKIDIWSVGCMLMELILGPKRFHEIWMINYSNEEGFDKEQFAEGINGTIKELKDLLFDFSAEVKDLILKLLAINAFQRPGIPSLVNHPWLIEYMKDAMVELELMKAHQKQFSSPKLNMSLINSRDPSDPNLGNGDSRPWSPPQLNSAFSFSLESKEGALNGLNSSSSKNSSPALMIRQASGPGPRGAAAAGGGHAQEVIKAAYENLSDKERKQIEEYILQQRQGNEPQENMMKLPPITPSTPSVSHARKILRRGEELANRSMNEQSSNSSSHASHILASNSHDALHTMSINAPMSPLHSNNNKDSSSFHSPMTHQSNGSNNNSNFHSPMTPSQVSVSFQTPAGSTKLSNRLSLPSVSETIFHDGQD
jgi:hypothetical protein